MYQHPKVSERERERQRWTDNLSTPCLEMDNKGKGLKGVMGWIMINPNGSGKKKIPFDERN